MRARFWKFVAHQVLTPQEILKLRGRRIDFESLELALALLGDSQLLD